MTTNETPTSQVEAWLFLAEGFEDMEALGTRDVLLRGKVAVRTVSLSESKEVTSSHGLSVRADMAWDTFQESHGAALEAAAPRKGKAPALIFPGGMPGSRNLAAHEGLIRLLRRHYATGGSVAAICAAPGLVLSQLDGLEGLRFTCFEGFQDALLAKGAVYTAAGVTCEGRVITGRSAGYAVDFGLALVDYLHGSAVAAEVRKGLMP